MTTEPTTHPADGRVGPVATSPAAVRAERDFRPDRPAGHGSLRHSNRTRGGGVHHQPCGYIQALGEVKRAAAEVKTDLGLLDPATSGTGTSTSLRRRRLPGWQDARTCKTPCRSDWVRNSAGTPTNCNAASTESDTANRISPRSPSYRLKGHLAAGVIQPANCSLDSVAVLEPAVVGHRAPNSAPPVENWMIPSLPASANPLIAALIPRNLRS
jgi:hypothetical protein